MITAPKKRAPTTGATEHPDERIEAEADRVADDNTVVDLGRLAWVATVGVCLITVLVLVLQGYFGYAAVTFAVAAAAAINLF